MNMLSTINIFIQTNMLNEQNSIMFFNSYLNNNNISNVKVVLETRFL